MINDSHKKYLADRGVSLQTAEEAGLRSVDSAEGARLLGHNNRLGSGGLAIPYLVQEGQALYYRLRMDIGDIRRAQLKAGLINSAGYIAGFSAPQNSIL